MTLPQTSEQLAAAASPPRFGMWPAVAVFGLSLAATLMGWRFSQEEVERQQRAEFDLRVTEIRTSINTNMRAYTQVLRGAAAFLAHSEIVTRSDWRIYISGLKLEQNFPAIQAVALARLVNDSQLDALVREVRASGIPEFAVRPPGRRSQYVINVLAEPYAGLNIKALGYDMWQDADRRVTMERARDSGEAMITQRITLRVDESSNPVPAFIMYLPVIKRGGGFYGYVLSPFRMPALMKELLGDNRRGIAVTLHDGADLHPGNLFYSSGPAHSEHPARFTHQESLTIGGRTWTLSYASLPAFESLQDNSRPVRTLVGGSIISLLLFLIAWSLTTTRRRALLIAQEMTLSLRESQEHFSQLVESAPYGIALLNADDSIAHVNTVFTRMFGYRLRDIPDLDAWRQKAYPDPGYRAQVIRNWQETMSATTPGAEVRQTFKVRRADGIQRDVEFILVRLDGQRKLLTFADITERKQMELSIAEERSKYKALFDAANDGIFVIDKTGYIACNQRGASLYGLKEADLIGRGPLDFSPERQPDGRLSREVAAEKTRAVMSGKAQRFEWQCRHPNGQLLDVEITLSRIRFGGKLCAQAIVRDITERKQAEELIWKQANFDTLTGLPNRRMFHDRLAQEIKKAHRASLQLALLFIDLDHFKEINDTLGHNMGDILLVDAAHRIGECIRETDTVARLGGDEFTVLLTALEDAGNVERVALSILRKLAEPFQLGEHLMVVSASIGITFYPSDATDIDELLKSADQAMYVAKKQGRNRYSYFTPALQEEAQNRLLLINDMRNAAAGGQLRVHFQPIVDLASGEIHKAEALIRWQHPQRGLVSPAAFIPLAEETGLIFEIGDWVFKESARWVRHWRDKHHLEFQVSVNKSPVQFFKDGNQDGWLAHLREIGLSGQGMAIEITEGLLLNSDSPIMDSLLAYRDNGIQVAIDDFGTGYSSLSYLKKFDIDYLKIDQSFTRNLAPGSSDMALSEAIIVMAHKLGLKVIAEGVETPEQRDLLAAAGCDYGQGYLFSRPVPPEEFEQLLLRKDLGKASG